MLVSTLTDIDPHYPTVSQEAHQALLEARKQLETEAPPGPPADPYEAAKSGG